MLFVAAFAIYWFTLAPTFWVGDSGELIAAAHVLGIPHPTGYPLWLLATKAFELLCPFGSVSWRANLFSAVCAAAAAQMVGAALRRMGCGKWAAAAGGLAFAFLAPIWGEATVARTYPLAALFSAAMWWCSARLIRDGSPRWLLWHQALLGLGLANHTMVIAHVPAIAALTWARQRELLKRPAVVAGALLAVLPGLALYGWLPWRAAADPPLEFRVSVIGEDGRARATELEERAGLRSYLQRESYQERRWAESLSDHATIARHHLGEAARQWTPLGVAFVVLGAVASWFGGRRAVVVAAALAWLGNLLPLALHGAWWDVFLYSRYLTCGWVALALLAGLGVDAFLRWRPVARIASKPVAGGAIALALPALLLGVNFRECDRREAWLAADYGRALLAELPPGAQYIGAGDVALYPLLALRYAEGERSDVTIVARSQLKGEADLVLARDAARSGAPPPANPRLLFTADLAAGPQERMEMERRGLLWQLRLPGTPPTPHEPFAAPAIRGLDRDERDPFARSVIGAIEADLADAAAVRGDLEQARARLRRVAALRCPRPWGAATGIATLLRVAREEQQAAQFAAARGDLVLAAELARVSLECGDARDPLLRLQAPQIEGWTGWLDAQELQVSDPPRGLDGLRRAAELLERPDIAAVYVRALMKMGKRQEAEAACARHRARYPASPDLEQLARELGIPPKRGG